MRLRPADIVLPARPRRRLCRGSYVGYVYLNREKTNIVIGTFSFGVGRSPVRLSGAGSPLISSRSIGFFPRARLPSPGR